MGDMVSINKPKTCKPAAPTISRGAVINTKDVSADYYDSMGFAREHGSPVRPYEIILRMNNDPSEGENLKGFKYWLLPWGNVLKNDVSGHCKINGHGKIVNISGSEWLSLEPNERIFVKKGNNPDNPVLLNVVATSTGYMTYIELDSTTDPKTKVNRIIYTKARPSKPQRQLLRVA